ncbi:hypothetical protein E3P92_02540 [Wallemia ichthyophaga]|uniref:Uncharacterized protein n=1 Tax=Wallemia ichthyophaga TaxID=245174 RepID=A0A4T0E628_WALIC|nr:hypothetical protein E3P91_03691 [Wallemia ichthyophaga]TIA81028.1 hypothetical protein E3P98_02297 [Wallemia ichthyophaga]TIA90242.1 hypothetical protein E3P97_02619 [Wallemia ichthyophaga]TIA98891.1 hypothetical protein E3P95_02262 [Wallemia ichthyophaga]TIB00086.1 hypothetical protein E3P94_02319 [Wallemia ichthyophaga]
MSNKLRLVALPIKATTATTATPQITLLSQPPTVALQENYLTKTINWCDRQWNKLSDSADGHWKKRVWNGGESVMDRVPYTEWALKHIEPGQSVAPNSTHKLDILYPKSVISDKDLLNMVKASFISRAARHRRSMWIALFIAPITLPVAIIPVVPNLPLFYVLWRAWSHWRAHRGAVYLGRLLANNQLNPRESDELDRFISTHPNLTNKDINTLSKILKLPPQATLEAHRAVKQIDSDSKRQE